MSKNLYLFRGVSGCGKSTVAESIAYCAFSADDYFVNKDGEYNWNPRELPQAHQKCLSDACEAMEHGIPRVAVANTFIKATDMQPYIDCAEKHDYMVHTLVVENRHGGTNQHDVPETTLQRMESNLQIKLR